MNEPARPAWRRLVHIVPSLDGSRVALILGLSSV
jgi:hypothetical protein